MNFIIYFHPFLTRIKQIYAHKCILTKPFQLCANDSHFAQSIYLIDKTDKIPCAILEWSDTILELRNQVGILTLRRTILEWYRFPLCAEHVYVCTCRLWVFFIVNICIFLMFEGPKEGLICQLGYPH